MNRIMKRKSTTTGNSRNLPGSVMTMIMTNPEEAVVKDGVKAAENIAEKVPSVSSSTKV